MFRFSIVLAGSYTLVCGFALAAAGGTPPGGAISSADVHIESVTGSITRNSFTCKISVNNQNDDNSYDTKVIVLLPLQVQRILRMTVDGRTGQCIRGPAYGGYREYATCQLGSLSTHQPPRIVEITTSPSTALPGYEETCSAFVYSQMGDIDKTNNYCYWPKNPTWCTPKQ